MAFTIPSEIAPELLLDRLQMLYDVISVIDFTRDIMIQIKDTEIGVPEFALPQVPYSKLLSVGVGATVCPEDQQKVLEFLKPDAIRKALTSPDGQCEMVFLSHQKQWKKINLLPLTFKDGKVEKVLYLHHDCSVVRSQNEVLRRENSRLLEVSERDKLTNLYNRNKLERMIETEYKGMHSCGVLFFDVNSLKQINDQYGHSAGDTLLRQVADSIRSITSRNVLAYRYGGDEFIAVVGNHPVSYMEMLIELCDSRLRHLSRHSGIPSSVTVGHAYAVAPFDVRDLIRQADEDMYEHKRADRQPLR